ncbi:MAG TPA: hypothetical protein VM695_09575 [Phycisphaerae bacterium]|nr:hypothetical protein [Phycisphaerae bacterium]
MRHTAMQSTGTVRPGARTRRRGQGSQAGQAVPVPPSLDGRTLVRVPYPYREDALQVAWVAHLEGHSANRAVVAYVNFRRRREARTVCFSQLDPERWAQLLEETAG